MTPAARTQAAIELLDGIVASARDGGAAADTLVARYFATRRYAGSKDRRAVREQVYAALPGSPRTKRRRGRGSHRPGCSNACAPPDWTTTRSPR